MSTYTDPRLLDVAGAMDALPSLPLDVSASPQRQKATGTHAAALVAQLVVNPDNRRTSGAIRGQLADSQDDAEFAASAFVDDACASLTDRDKKRVMRFELTTFTLATGKHPTEVTQSPGLITPIIGACSNACSDNAETAHEGAKSGDACRVAECDDFGDSLAMIDRLPLTDAEKAEAVRRLLQSCEA